MFLLLLAIHAFRRMPRLEVGTAALIPGKHFATARVSAGDVFDTRMQFLDVTLHALECCKHLVATRVSAGDVRNSSMYRLDVPPHVAHLGEHLIAARASARNVPNTPYDCPYAIVNCVDVSLHVLLRRKHIVAAQMRAWK
jgi:hypothetical protein